MHYHVSKISSQSSEDNSLKIKLQNVTQTHKQTLQVALFVSLGNKNTRIVFFFFHYYPLVYGHLHHANRQTIFVIRDTWSTYTINIWHAVFSFTFLNTCGRYHHELYYYYQGRKYTKWYLIQANKCRLPANYFFNYILLIYNSILFQILQIFNRTDSWL